MSLPGTENGCVVFCSMWPAATPLSPPARANRVLSECRSDRQALQRPQRTQNRPKSPHALLTLCYRVPAALLTSFFPPSLGSSHASLLTVPGNRLGRHTHAQAFPRAVPLPGSSHIKGNHLVLGAFFPLMLAAPAAGGLPAPTGSWLLVERMLECQLGDLLFGEGAPHWGPLLSLGLGSGPCSCRPAVRLPGPLGLRVRGARVAGRFSRRPPKLEQPLANDQRAQLPCFASSQTLHSGSASGDPDLRQGPSLHHPPRKDRSDLKIWDYEDPESLNILFPLLDTGS